MSATAVIIGCAAMIAVSIVFSMVGQGGGALYVPILLALGVSFHTASTTSLFIIIVASLSATLIYARKRVVDWKLLLAITPLALGTSFLGGYIAQFVAVTVLKIIFAAVLIIAAIFLLRPASDTATRPRFVPAWGCSNRCCGEYKYSISMLLILPGTALAGFIAGMIGVGGGLFVLPLLVLLAGCPMRIGVGISSTYVGIAAVAGFLGHVVSGHFDPWSALPLAAAAFVGARIGPSISLKTDVRRLRMLLAVVIIIASAWMAANVFIT